MTLRCDTKRQSATVAAGFTLLEMLIVLTILGFALVLVIGYRPPWSRELDIEATAAQIASQLRLERSAAIAGNKAAVLELDLKAHAYRSGAMPPQPLPAGLSLELLTVAGEQRGAADAGDIQFNPDGSSSGGRIVLGDGARKVAIGVDWLTGKVSVADVR